MNRPELKHVGLYVWDVQRMERYYTDVFQLMVTDRGKVARLGNKDVVFLSAAADAHHQLVLVGARPAEGSASVVNQLSFKVRTVDELRALHARMKGAAAADITSIDHGNAWSLYSTDPEGNGVEAYMDTPWHVSQPHARPLDLSLTNAQLHAATETAVKEDASFQSREDWMRHMAQTLERTPAQ